MTPMRRALALALFLLVAPTCAPAHSVAMQRVLPPIPSEAPTALGPIPIRRVPNLMCDSVPAFGCFHRNTWVIELRTPMPLALAWISLQHELFHADMQVGGIEFESAKDEDQIAEGAAQGQVLRMRAGFPR